MGKIYIIGICILIIAVLANIVADKLGLQTWYTFLNGISTNFDTTIKNLRFFDGVWLFVVYPVFLGLGYVLGTKLYQFIFG